MTSPRRASFEDVDVLISDGDDAPATTIEVPTVPLKRMEGKLYRRSQKFALYVGRTFVLDAGTLSYTSTAKEESVDIDMTNVRAVKKLNPAILTQEDGLHAQGAREAFKMEIDILSALRHPNILLFH